MTKYTYKIVRVRSLLRQGYINEVSLPYYMGLNEFAKLDKNRRLNVFADHICEKAIREAIADARPHSYINFPFTSTPGDEILGMVAPYCKTQTLFDLLDYCIRVEGDIAPPHRIYRRERERDGVLEELERVIREFEMS